MLAVNLERSNIRWTVWLEVAISLVAAAVGVKFAYGVGMRMDGMWLGLIMGFNGGLFCLLMASLLTERIFRRKPTKTGG